MKRFTWRIILCAAPILASILVIGMAYRHFAAGEGGFKFGVDLVGGTDLIYEVDRSKFTDSAPAQGNLPRDFRIGDLAAALKKRIDPADLYNATIRPVSDSRVEIILPTGGRNQVRKEEEQWRELIDAVSAHWPPKSYQVALGNRIELMARVNEQYPDVGLDEVRKFIDERYDPKTLGADAAKRETAWKNLLAAASEKWKPQKYEAGRGRTVSLEIAVRGQYPEATATEIKDYIESHYAVKTDKRALTTEEAERIKKLIADVGNLEFRILANTTDDKDAIEAATKYFAEAAKNQDIRDTLERLALQGKPPPPPLGSNDDPTFDTATDIGRYSYSWVEVGKEERKSLGLNNAAEESPTWKQAAEARAKGETMRILGDQCLLYSRKVLNARLEDKDANKRFEYFILTRNPEKGQEVTGQFLSTASVDFDQKKMQWEIRFSFDRIGADRFWELTSKNAPASKSETAFKRHLAVIYDGMIDQAPYINEAIRDSGSIGGGNMTREEASRRVDVLRAGALPASLKSQPVSESTMGPTLGEDTIRAGTISVGVAFVVVMAFMVLYYWFAGLVACVALLANLIMTIAFMVVVNATFTLPGLAGLVLTLGMAVDANVLIYERLREERERGASLGQALRNGYDRAFPTIIDTHLSSIFTAIVLYAVGNDQLKGFGISLTVGLVISLFTSLFMTRLLFDIWQYQGWLKKLTMMKLFSKPNIDFMAIRYYWFTATIILTILGATLFVYRLDRGGLNIDFTRGTAYSGQLKKPVSMIELRSMLQTSKLPDFSIEQTFISSPEFSEGEKSKLFTIRTSETDPNKVLRSVNELLGASLRKTVLQSYEIDEGAHKGATLAFVDPDSGKPASASVAQVSMLLTSQLKDAGLSNLAEQFSLEGIGKEEEGRFQWMHLQFLQPIKADELQTVLKSTQAAFAAMPQPERLENFDSQLAKETQKRALYAILASWAAILLYLWFRFGSWTFGLAAVVCLIHDLFFTLGAIAICHYIHTRMPGLANILLIQDFKIDLPTVAALLTLVGYSVNDTIVVFDRIREVRGKNPELTPQTINDSVNQTLSRTLLTSFATWLVVIVLYIWGGEGVHLFAFVMVVGIVVGTYSSIYIASPLLLIFREGAPAKPRSNQVSAQPAKALT
jgi:SecD/SecF fusion protein